MREICWLGQKCDLHKEAVQQRHNWKIVRVSRTQCCELPTHLDEIERFVIRLLFQIKLAQKPYIKRSRRAEYIGATASPRWTRTKGNVRCGEVSLS
ncbi:hypothetical protein SAMN05216525_101583 [Bradyrhizobium sp. Gha]|nr:hypothetical protein SAMN05216525_101583 [Bradyrhizobium sp. Gha]